MNFFLRIIFFDLFFQRIYDTKILTNYCKEVKESLGEGNSILEKMYELY